MSKEIKKWTGDGSSHEYTDLPTDYPYRKLLLQGRYNDNPPNWVFANIKLSEDQDKKVVINNEFLELLSGLCRENAEVIESWTVSGNSGATHLHVTPTLDVVATASPKGVETGGKEAALDGGDGGYMGYRTESIYDQNIIVRGFAPHGTLCIPFGDQKLIEDWYAVRNIGSLQLDIKDGVSSATLKVFIQQYRAYS